MSWWLFNAARGREERHEVAGLTERSPWLQNVKWHVADDLALSIDFDVQTDSDVFPLTLTFSSFHPSAPPSVMPRDDRDLSGHQYGAGGTLCLEWRADNWQPAITAAMMMESAFRLLSGQLPGGGQAVRSAHFVSVGQGVRGVFYRFLISHLAADLLKTIEVDVPVGIGLAEKGYANALTTTLFDIDGMPFPAAWPSGVSDVRKRGFALRLSESRRLPTASLQSLSTFLGNLGLEAIKTDLLTSKSDVDLVLISGEKIVHFQAWGAPERRAAKSSTVFLPAPGPRLPDAYQHLGSRSVAIVGCGSLGSKIAASLARSGVGKFLLVDDDLLFADNLVRNELGMTAVGAHKVDALSARLKDIAGTLEVKTRAVALGGQESAESTESVMTAIGACDIIVDATANSHCFNFCAAAARREIKPLVWGEVFGGGIGAIVARVRSPHDPEPHLARNQINAWCDAHDVPAPESDPENRYAILAEDSRPPLIADDAEVAIVAGHMTRFVVDILVSPEHSMFPASAYAVGLRQAWIFSAPFDTWPIELVDGAAWVSSLSKDDAADGVALFLEIQKEDTDGADRPAE